MGTNSLLWCKDGNAPQGKQYRYKKCYSKATARALHSLLDAANCVTLRDKNGLGQFHHLKADAYFLRPRTGRHIESMYGRWTVRYSRSRGGNESCAADVISFITPAEMPQQYLFAALSRSTFSTTSSVRTVPHIDLFAPYSTKLVYVDSSHTRAHAASCSVYPVCIIYNLKLRRT
jgi:hypothetical protein